MKIIRLLTTTLGSLLLGGCVSLPEGIEPVSAFELDRYLGTWYEIARLDHPFERGLSQITADYSRRDDGGVRVVNRGFKAQTGQWKEVGGRAYFVDQPSIGRLKVSFFGPFYGGYNIIALDQSNYQWAMICGPNRDYLWILARQPELEEQILESLIKQAKEFGFATEALIMVDQRR
jgi:apolipoprotein D and lipocalin family protein